MQTTGLNDFINNNFDMTLFMTDIGYRTGYKSGNWYLRPEEAQYADTRYGLELLVGRMPDKMYSYLEEKVRQMELSNSVSEPIRTASV